MVAKAAEARQHEIRSDLGFSYSGVELDDPAIRPVIQDFLDHTEWGIHLQELLEN